MTIHSDPESLDLRLELDQLSTGVEQGPQSCKMWVHNPIKFQKCHCQPSTGPEWKRQVLFVVCVEPTDMGYSHWVLIILTEYVCNVQAELFPHQTFMHQYISPSLPFIFSKNFASVLVYLCTNTINNQYHWSGKTCTCTRTTHSHHRSISARKKGLYLYQMTSRQEHLKEHPPDTWQWWWGWGCQWWWSRL